MDNNIFRIKRKVTSKWHIEQAERLLQTATNRKSSSALIYAALEARNAIERFVFEMSVLATGGCFSDYHLRLAQKKDGIFELLKQAMENYRKHIKFTNLILNMSNANFQVSIPNLKTFKQHRTSLSEYCHCQLNPTITIDEPESKWFKKGIGTIEKAIDYINDQFNKLLGAISRNSMPDEVRDLFDQYIKNEVNDQSAKMQLTIMEPVLKSRFNNTREK